MSLKKLLLRIPICINKLFLLVCLFVIHSSFSQVPSVILNGDFEEGANEWQFYSFSSGTTTPFNTTSDGSPFNYDGTSDTFKTAGARWTSATSAGDSFSFRTRYAYQPLDLVSGQEYVFEFEYAIKTDVAEDPTGGRRIVGTVIKGHFLDGSDVIDTNNQGVINSELEIVNIIGDEVNGKGNFKKVSVSFVAPENGEVSVVFYAVTPVDAYLDNVKVYSYSSYLTDETFKKAIEDCLATNPVDGMCSDQEYGAMPDWNVSSVTNMEEAFKGYSGFNANIGGWDVKNVTSMRRMFYEASSFNQTIAWDLSSVTDMTEMLSFSGMSTDAYESTLFGWSERVGAPSNIVLGADGLIYCDETNRDVLINDFGWTILNDNSCYDGTDFTSFELLYQLEDAVIDTDNHTVSIDVSKEIDVTALSAYFSLSELASTSMGVIDQQSGVTVNDFTSPVMYTVTAGDGSVQDWVITVNKVDATCINTYPYEESFEDDLGFWRQPSSIDAGDWYRSYVSGFSAGRGPDKAKDGLYYLYSSAYNAPIGDNRISNLESSGCFDVSSLSNPVLMFSYHMMYEWSTDRLVSLDVEVSSDFKQTWSTVWSKSGNQGVDWHEAVVDLKAYKTTGPLFIRFKMSTESGISAYVTIDYIRIKEATDETNIDGFSVSGQFSPAVIDNVNKTISVEFLESIDLTNLVASFSLSEGAKSKVDGVDQDSGVTVNDFSNSVIYTVVAGDGTEQDWIVQKTLKTDSSSYDFVTTWDTTANSFGSSDTEIIIPTYPGLSYNYEVDWDNDGVFDEQNITSNVTHDFGVEGTYTIRIRGVFPAIYFRYATDAEKILSVEQWGPNVWETMDGAFYGCMNLTYLGSDNPNLTSVKNMRNMFRSAELFNHDIGSWNVSKVENMYGMFSYAENFNQDIGEWNVSNVSNFTVMFNNAENFNQDIGDWNLDSAIKTSFMFLGAENFNHDIGRWKLDGVLELRAMFDDAISFNQDISNWDMSNALDVGRMFQDAVSFDQDLGDWNLSSVTDMEYMFNQSGMSTVNYDKTLSGWSNNASTPNNITLGAEGMFYCNSKGARGVLINNKNWEIIGDDFDCTGVEILSSDLLIVNNNVKAYPNPVLNELNVVFPEVIEGSLLVKGYSSLGELVLSQEIKVEKNKVVLPVSGLKSGFYLFKFYVGDSFYFVKILKE